MDLRNICQKLDVDGLRARLPALPSLSLPVRSLKMPKSLPKLKSRKIFKSSKENVLNKSPPEDVSVSLAPPLPPRSSRFVNHSPNRISTISSLVANRTEESCTYQSAESIDEDYPSPGRSQRFRQPISPVHATNFINTNPTDDVTSKTSLSTKIQKGYREFREFKIQHIFSKRTVIRTDIIQVEQYVESFEQQHLREQQDRERRDSQIADNYILKFKEARQKPGQESQSFSSQESTESEPQKERVQTNRKQRNFRRSNSEHSGDESGMEGSPPPRSKKIVLESSQINVQAEHVEPVTLENKTLLKTCKEHLNRWGNYLNPSEKNKQETDNTSSSTSLFGKIRNFSHRPKAPQESDNDEPTNAPNTGSMHGLKQNFKKLHKTLRHQSGAVDKTDNETDESPKEQTKFTSSTRQKIKTHFRKFTGSQEQVEEAAEANSMETKEKPATLGKRLGILKKSFKASSSEESHTDVTKRKRSDTLMRKLKYIRSRKATNSNDELEDAASQTASTSCSQYISKEEQKFERIQQRPWTKPQEHVKYYSSSEEEEDAESECQCSPVANSLPRPSFLQGQDFGDQCSLKELNQLQQQYGSQRSLTTAWSTKPLDVEGNDEDSEPESGEECIQPAEVLIHQQLNEGAESTLIIAVSQTSLAALCSTSEDSIKQGLPIIKSKSSEWIPNKQIVTEFKNLTPPQIHRKLSKDSFKSAELDISRLAPACPDEDIEDAWVSQNIPKIKLNRYKSKSIDIFETSSKNAAFVNFELELEMEPVVRIELPRDVDGFEATESSEDADDDNSSRITKIEVRPPPVRKSKTPAPSATLKVQATTKFGNSRESLIDDIEMKTHQLESSDEDDDRPPSVAPSPPPSTSPPPPPLPQRQSRPPLQTAASFAEPPLKATPPPQIPQRTASMSRIGKPLVKTSSLRLAYKDQVKPSDVGKVNKLISRFEPGQCNPRPRIIPRRLWQDDEEDEEESESDTCEEDNNSNNNAITLNTSSPIPMDSNQLQISTNSLDCNSNCSRNNSLYGSPMEYPSSLKSSKETTPTPIKKSIMPQRPARSRRTGGLLKEDENYFSFDSDEEENSYYSISPGENSRFVVNL